ncbi:MAG TPA: hypothetical protein VM598_14410 [Bdellovibrionota bacterium]|nr:hypothetical protein [Bdellovibrionota bacterium]
MSAKPQEKSDPTAPPGSGPVRASVVLLCQGKLPDVMSEYVSHVTRQKTFGAVEVKTGEEAIRVLRASGGGLLVFAVTDRLGLSEILRALVGLDLDIRKGIVRCLGMNATALPEANRILLKKGCSEVLEKTVSMRALMHKADRWRKFVEQKLAERRRLSASPAERRDVSKTPRSAVAAAQAQISPEARLVAALDGEFDIWLVRSKVPAKRVMGKWFMELVGPGPSISRWVSRGPHKDEGSIEQEWYFEVSEEGPLKPKGGAWVFRGRKPEFKWSSNRWLFVAAKPTLIFRAEDGKETIKARLEDAGGLEIASNSKRALGIEPHIRESVEAAEVFKNERSEQGNKKLDGDEGEESGEKKLAKDAEEGGTWNDKRTADEEKEGWGDKRSGDEQGEGWDDKRTGDDEDKGWGDKRAASEDAGDGSPKAKGQPDEEDDDPAAVAARARAETAGKSGKDGASKDSAPRAGAARGADDRKGGPEEQSSENDDRPAGEPARGGKAKGKLTSVAGGKASARAGGESEEDGDSPFNDRQSEGERKPTAFNDKQKSGEKQRAGERTGLEASDDSQEEAEQEGGWDPFSEMRKKKAKLAAARAQAEGKDEEASRASKDGKPRAFNDKQGKSKDGEAAPFNDKQGDGKSAASPLNDKQSAGAKGRPSPFNDKQTEGDESSSPFNDRQTEGEAKDPTQLNDRRSGKTAAAKWNKHGLSPDETRGWGNLLEDLGPYVYVQLEPKVDGIKGRLSDICEFEVTFEIANTDLSGRKTLDFRIEAFHEGFKIEIRDQVEVLACDPIEEGYISVTVRVPEKHVRSLDRLRELVALRQESVQNFMLAARGM